MTQLVGAAWDGWARSLIPGDDFTVPVSLVGEWFAFDEAEQDAYELPVPELGELEDKRAVYQNPIPFHEEQQAWAAVAVTIKAICELVGGKADAFQTNHYNDAKRLESVEFHFRYESSERRGAWQGGRL